MGRKKSAKRSPVWKYYTQDQEETYAQCKICDKKLHPVGGSTSVLFGHLETHQVKKETILQLSTPSPGPSNPRPSTSLGSNQKSIMNFATPKSKRNDADDDSDVEELINDTTATTASDGRNSTPSTFSAAPSAEDSQKSFSAKKVDTKQTDMRDFTGPTRTYFDRGFVDVVLTAIAVFIATDLVPISVVEGLGFIAMVKVMLGSKFIVPSRDKILTKLKILRDDAVVEILEKLSSADKINLTTDCWTSRAGHSYITATSHFINENWQIVKHTLFTCSMPGRHTFSNLIAILENKIVEWGISSKILSTTSDNAYNIIKAVKESPMLGENNGCFAHKLHLCVMDIFNKNKNLNKLLKKCKKLVGHFKHSPLASNALKEKQKALNLEENKLIQGVKTRWNSYIFMFESIIKNFSAISEVLDDPLYTKKKIAKKYEISLDERDLIKTLIYILRPFTVTLTRACGETYVTASEVRPMIFALLTKLDPSYRPKQLNDAPPVIVPEQFYSEDGKKLRLELAKNLNTRFKLCPPWLQEALDQESNILEEEGEISGDLGINRNAKQNNKATLIKSQAQVSKELFASSSEGEDGSEIESDSGSDSESYSGDEGKNKKKKDENILNNTVSVLQIASFLDPRYKNLLFENASDRGDIRNAVEYLYNKELILSGSNEEEQSPNDTEFDQLFDVDITDDNAESLSNNEFELYRLEPTTHLKKSANPLEWWRVNERKFPILAKIAKQYLSIPATSAASERVFSSAGNIVTAKRCSLLPENVDMLVFLHQNSHLRNTKRRAQKRKN